MWTILLESMGYPMRSFRKLIPEPVRALRRSLIALGHLPDLWRRVEDLGVSVEQLQTVVHELGGAPPPPRELQVRVVGVYGGGFLQSGHQAVADMERVLGRHALTLQVQKDPGFRLWLRKGAEVPSSIGPQTTARRDRHR